jgi:hypothetical protein
MPTIFAASESTIMVNGVPVEGVRSIEYRRHRVRENIYALGTAERIGMTSGPQLVEGKLRVASTSPALDGLAGDDPFQIIAQLKHGDVQMTVSFDDCFLQEKSFDLGVGSHGESVYAFTATRVNEEPA